MTSARRLALLALALLPACGGGGGASSVPSTPGPTPTPAPLTNVAYVPYSDTVEAFAFNTSQFLTAIPLPNAAAPIGDLAVDPTGTILYADASTSTGPQLVAENVTSAGGTPIASIPFTSQAGRTSIVPLGNGNVALFTVPSATSSQNVALYSSTLNATVLAPTATSGYASPVASSVASDAFFAVDNAGYIDEIALPSFAVLGSSKLTAFVTAEPIVADSSNHAIYTTIWDPAQNATTLYASSQTTFTMGAIVRVPGIGRVYAAAGGLVIVGVGVAPARLYVITPSTGAVVPIDLSSQPGTLVSAALRADGASVIAALNNGGTGELFVFDSASGKPVTFVSRPEPIVGAVVTH